MFHVYSGDANYRSTHLYEDGAMLQPGLDPAQWVQVHVTKEIIVEPGTLWVSVEYETDNKPEIGVDSTHFDRYGDNTGDQIMYWFRTYGNSFGESATDPYSPIAGHLMIKVQAEKLDISPRERVVEASSTGLGFAVIAVEAGAALPREDSPSPLVSHGPKYTHLRATTIVESIEPCMVCRRPVVVSSRTQIPQTVKDPFYSPQSNPVVLPEILGIRPRFR